ncbi:uncharacterized protein [Coffea arabica]|uniref:Reverse transcriptase domain-containing protein n=1 Tax=Coffea arabica TaxID=13443 RepID=A0ABM4X544_COFAR
MTLNPHLKGEDERQKARIKWAKDGDSNTRFFHVSVWDKRAKLTIHRIKDEAGLWVEEEEQIAAVAERFFKDLLAADEPVEIEALVQHIPSLVTEDHNNRLLGDVTLEKVRQATKDFMAGTPIPKGISSTLIVLIPKKSNPFFFADFQPISLCTFVNKVLPKSSLTDCESFCQLLSRQSNPLLFQGGTVENILLAQELVGSVNRKARGHNCILKLDMIKAFDRVS